MRRQLTPEQSEKIASSLTLPPDVDLGLAFKEAMVKISGIQPAFTVRDFTSVWLLRQPGFRWDKDKDKIFYGLVLLDGRKGFWVLKQAPALEEDLPPAEVEEEESLLEGEALSGENLTRPWIQEALKRNEHVHIAQVIKKKFPHERKEELASDVSELMLTWGERGLCDAFLRRNKPPTRAILAIWAEQKIRQRVYKDGTDALHREIRGLRTQTEIRKRKELSMDDLILEQGLKPDPNSPKTVWVIQEGGERQCVVVAPEPEEAPQDQSQKLDLVRAFILAKRKRSPERYARVFDHLQAGTPKGEIALLEGCSELKVSHLTNKVRGDLRESSKFLSVALLLLRKISEEPFSTLEEIQEENPALEAAKIEQAIEVLLKGDLISEKQGRSFLVTEAGRLLGQEA
jgi:hypothetical protein